jgi:DNA ligase D-like protein (predicted 3'-phosphoesterase)
VVKDFIGMFPHERSVCARFVVHKHRARNLHWDLRIELDGVLKSWAVPKEPPTEPGVKRLAILVEDHELDYIDFEGTIEEGYGAGTVEIWDRGEYDISEFSDEGMSLVLRGERMRGKYRLLHWKGENWLLFRIKD